MTEGKAQDLVNGAALIVSAIYFYRKLIEPAVGAAGSSAGPDATEKPTAGEPHTVAGAAAQLLGQGEVASTGRFVVGWGFTFLTLSLMAPAAPELAGAFAALVALGSILGNGTQLASDLEVQLNRQPTPPQTLAPTATTTVAYAGQSQSSSPALFPSPAAKTPRKHKPAKYKLESV